MPHLEQAPLYNAINMNLPTWVADNSTVVVTQINVFLCPSANNPDADRARWSTPTANLLPVANQHFARANYQYNMGWNDTSMPATVNLRRPGRRLQRADLPEQQGPATPAVTDGLSNTVFAGEKTPLPRRRHLGGDHPRLPALRLQRFASLGTGGTGVNYDYPGAILAAHSGPSLYEDPMVIHPPNSPLGHTDEMYSLHPGGANVLMGDGSVRFIKQSINLLTWQALCSRCGGEVISADAY